MTESAGASEDTIFMVGILFLAALTGSTVVTEKWILQQQWKSR